MKTLRFIAMIIPVIMLGCKLTGSGQNSAGDAVLIVENLTSINIYLTVDDGSLGPYPEYLMPPGTDQSFNWDEDDPIFTEYNGIAYLSYHDDENNYESAQVTVFAGQTNYFTISENATVLIVFNDTASEAWFTIDDDNFTSLYSGESEIISFGELNSLYLADFYYSGYHVFSNNLTLELAPFTTEEFDIEANAGAVEVRNYGLSDIVDIYIAPSDSPYWGPDLLNQSLETGDSGIWTVETGWWDVKTRNQYGEENEFYDRYVPLDVTEFIGVRLTGKKKYDVKKKEGGEKTRIEFKGIVDHQGN